MANTASSKKRARQSENCRQHNASQISRMRTIVKKVAKAVADQNKEVAAEAFKAAGSVLDRMSNKGLIHKNKAARHKRQLNTLVRNI